MARIKISAALKTFTVATDALIKLDRDNQTRFSRPTISDKRSLVMLSEGIFVSAFREFETFLEEVFILYTLEKTTTTNAKPRSYLKPKNYDHALELVKSSMPFLDWTSPDNVINRAETYLHNGWPVKLPLSTNRVILQDMKKVRNHIAHNSKESLKEYKKVLQKHYRTLPLSILKPGEYLQLMVPTAPTEHYLLYYLNQLRLVSVDLAS
jgi:hypothetical protein